MTAIVLAACSGGLTPVDSSGIAPAVSMPHVRIPGLHARNATLDGNTVALEMVHPDEAAATLEQAGLVGVTDRTLTGRLGVFSRVVVRGWSFATADGAASFVDWLQTNANEMIGDHTTLDASAGPGVTVLLHSPSGCCHEEVPIYLAAWQRGPTVWTVWASGPRIRTAPALALIDSIRKET